MILLVPSSWVAEELDRLSRVIVLPPSAPLIQNCFRISQYFLPSSFFNSFAVIANLLASFKVMIWVMSYDMGSTTSNIKEYFKADLQNLHNKVRHFLKTIIDLNWNTVHPHPHRISDHLNITPWWQKIERCSQRDFFTMRSAIWGKLE